MQPHLIKQFISYLLVMDVPLIPQKEYYYHHLSLSPSRRSFLAETPTGIRSGCRHLGRLQLAGRGLGEEGGPYLGAMGHPTPRFTPVPLANLRQWDGRGGRVVKPRFTAIRSISPSAANTGCSARLDSPPQGWLLPSRSRPATGLSR